jgi:tellurite resistance protein
MPEVREIPSSERLPYIQGLIFMARADGSIGPEERHRIEAALEQCALDTADAEAARAALDAPPDLEQICATLRGSPTRFTLYLDAVSLALDDGVVQPEEEAALQALRASLGLQGYEAEGLRQVAESLHSLKGTPEPEPEQVERSKEAIARLAAIGVPVGAAVLSGTVQGASGTALVAGLTALGFGFGIAGGVGVCVLLGFASYRGVRWLLDRGHRRTPTDDE